MTVKETGQYLRLHPKTVLKALASERIQAGSGLVGYQTKAPNGSWRIHRDDADAYQRQPTAGYGLKSA
ncbi:helix-turn-helix domain-containing protein [Rhodococcus jostii]|uniref:helix-turn-helix domain-containing protein n=1 Tax=Rhodococcus jostii TaxID=132919 RepID=UPI00364509BE